MNFAPYLFYLFSFILISSALIVVTTRNTVHCVMFLILAFINAAALFVTLGAEFFAMLLIIVYVGAIAVLFLFVVMMLNVDKKEVNKKINRHLPILIIFSAILFFEFFMIIKFSTIKFYEKKLLFPTPTNIPNTTAIGKVLYTDFILPFQLSGAILFVAMIGAIVLTLRDKKRFIRKQNISNQVMRDKKDCLEIVQVKSGAGINL